MFKLPRLSLWFATSLVLLLAVFLLYPHQVGVLLFKLSQVTLAGVIGYWLDRSLFPYSRPDGYLAGGYLVRAPGEPVQAGDDADYRITEGYEHIFAAALIRRALIVLGAMLAIGLGA
jgi:hypothetical protein